MRIFRSKLSDIIEYLYEYLRDTENVDDEYFVIDSSRLGVKYNVKTAKGRRLIEMTDYYIYYNDDVTNIFKVYCNGDVESKIPIKDVNLALRELVDLTMRNPLKYKKYRLEDKWLKWFK